MTVLFIGTMKTRNAEVAGQPKAVRDALEYLAETDFSQMKDGSYPIAEGVSEAIVQHYMTRPLAACIPEAHRKYIDIQYMLSGEEYLGWCPLSPDLRERSAYDEKRDIIFYDALVPESNVILKAGSFAVLYPSDVHRPQTAIDDETAPVAKVVVKIRVDRLHDGE